MDFLRRLLGPKPTTNLTTPRPPQITPPSSAPVVNTVPPTPVITVGTPAVELEDNTPTNRSSLTEATTEQLQASDQGLYGATRQLAPQESIAIKPGQHMIYGLSSDVGMVRNNNQDSLYTLFASSVSADGVPDFGLFIVADGMGGHHDGERASAVATRVIAKHVMEKFYLKIIDPLCLDKPLISEVLGEAIQAANESVAEEIPEGGTTTTAAVIVGDLSYIVHVGDSRAYLITQEGIEPITRDHSLVQRLIELGQLTPEEALVHPQRNVLYRAIGQSEHIEVDTVTRRLPPGARLLLCSDGLWNNVSENQLLGMVKTAKSPQDACDKLVAFANDRGGADNITVVLIQIPG